MKLLTLLSFIITVIAILSLITGLVINNKSDIDPKKKASVGLFIAFSMHIYIFLMCITGLFGLVKHYYLSVILLLFAVIPFIIGYFSSYRRIKLYTVYQIVSHIISLFILVWIYWTF